MTKSPAYSAGARYERKALKAYLTRKLNDGKPIRVSDLLEWISARRERYEKKPGGL
jgi:hypothetical protein